MTNPSMTNSSITRNATRTRRQLFGSALGIAGVAAAVRLAGTAGAETPSAMIERPAVALAPAERLFPPGFLVFPVQLPGELILLDNFGDSRTFGSGPHQGIDISRRDQAPGHPLVACIDGVVDGLRFDEVNQGNAVILIDAAGDRFRYHHLETFADGLTVGSRVVRGQVIGTMGATGNPQVPHLHFEVRRGPDRTPVDPVPFLRLPIAGVTVI
jgi:murein DD-endopeptidase MepM/ murein hydrolase activator NlpD